MKIERETDKKLKSDIKWDRILGLLHGIIAIFFYIVFIVYAFKFIDGHPSYRIIIFGFMLVFFLISFSQMYNANLIRKLTLEVRELKNAKPVKYAKKS